MKTVEGILTQFDLLACDDLMPAARKMAHEVFLTGVAGGLLLASELAAKSEHDEILDPEIFLPGINSILLQLNQKLLK